MRKIILILSILLSVTLNAQCVSTFAGSTMGFADGTGTNAQFRYPTGVAVDATGNVYVSDGGVYNIKIRKITPSGVVSTLAGSTQGYADGTGTAAQFNSINALAVDASGNIIAADGHKIRKITPSGVVTKLAGSTSGYADGIGTAAQFSNPYGVAVDASSNVYVADVSNHKIRKITPLGIVTTLAGSTLGYADGIGTAAQFSYPYGVAVDASGNVYVTDTHNDKIRKITPSGVVTTLAGSTQGSVDGTGANAQFYRPVGIVVDTAGNVYVGEDSYLTQFRKIRKITPSGLVTTLAGGPAGYADGSGYSALFKSIGFIAIDLSDNLYVGERENHRIRKIITNLSANISYTNSQFCKSLATAQPVTLTGTGAYTGGVFSSTTGLSLNSSTGVITPSASTSGAYTVTYTTSTSSGCAYTATAQVTISSVSSAPTGNSSQSLAPGSTLNSIIITGTNIQWYSSLTSSTPLANTTLLVNGTTYYASQTLNGCEGPRLAVTVQAQLGIEDFNSIKISYNPNPVIDVLNIKSDEFLKNVFIVNDLGQIIYSKKCSDTDLQLDFSGFSSGSYFVKVRSDQKQNVFKIIKK